MMAAGIDAGSRSIKVVLVDATSRAVVASAQCDQGVEQERLVRELFHELLHDAGCGMRSIAGVVATGYGRNLVGFADTTVTEITCHARGIHHGHPDAKTIVEIGGQDSKLLRLNGTGEVRDFMMNDRCAAGTGRFLEVTAARLGVPLDDLGRLAAQSTDPAVISSTCVVFAETEIIGLLASGAAPADIVAGVLRAISSRVGTMAGRVVQEPVFFTGGVARIAGMAQALEDILHCAIAIPQAPHMTGALGAALIAGARARSS